MVKDVCGNLLTPEDPIITYYESLTSLDFTAPVVLSNSAAPGVWYTDRYTPFGFSSPFAFGGNDRLIESINAADGDANRPPAYAGAFYNTQGRSYNLGTSSTYAEIELYVPAAWATTNKRMAGFWGVALDNVDVVSGYPIVEFTSDGNNPRFRVWESGTGFWVDLGLPAGFAYNTWTKLKIHVLPSGEFLINAGSLGYVTTTSAGDASVRLGNIILQGHNYDPVNPTQGVTYDIYWDNLAYNEEAAEEIACEGTVVYDYLYTDCSGLTFDWTYTYTIERNDFAVPANTGSIVQCVANAPTPVPPVVNDNCGDPLTPTSPVETGTYAGCEGTKIYTWTYTDCEGNTHPWVYTYTFDHTTAPSEMGGPVSTGSTIACVLNATPPTLPMVKDVCGTCIVSDGLPTDSAKSGHAELFMIAR